MPELPDVDAYVDALRARIVGQPLTAIRIASPFVVRTVTPAVTALEGLTVRDIRRLGKRVVFAFDDELFMVVHLMIAGRFQWKDAGPAPRTKIVLATFEFPTGFLILTEASSTKRAAIHIVSGSGALAEFDRGGLEVIDSTLDAFTAALTRENHTVKRALTDPRLFSGIGNAYSDEILHAARLSPLVWTTRLTPVEIARLWQATRDVLTMWSNRLRAEAAAAFPTKVTAFRPDMAVHGRYGKPCPVCGSPVQRIAYASNECNYCVTCQTGGRLLADRGMSRLLKDDWPRSLEELEEHKSSRRR